MLRSAGSLPPLERLGADKASSDGEGSRADYSENGMSERGQRDAIDPARCASRTLTGDTHRKRGCTRFLRRAPCPPTYLPATKKYSWRPDSDW
jgi:hypothetical protein